jgi:2-methylaconitate cis-trans-isomerase PrpF
MSSVPGSLPVGRAGEAILPSAALAGFVPRIVHGVVELPVYYMRGGTSTGIVLWHHHLPQDQALREEAIRWIMGVPMAGDARGNKQTTGLGRGIPTSNKVFIVDRAGSHDADIVSTLAQLAADRSSIDWSVNCGNMSAALPMYALDTGLAVPGTGRTLVRIFNTNTHVITDATVRTPDGTPAIPSDTRIPGVLGTFPGVELSLRNPVGAKTGKLLPTGRLSDVFCGVEASCVDVAVPMVILRAADLGKTGAEPIDELARDGALKQKLQAIWIDAGIAMGLRKRNGEPMSRDELARSETVPKVCLVSEPGDDAHIRVRYFTPQSPHNSLAVTGGCCLAVACLVPGTVAHGLARGLPSLSSGDCVCTVGMSNPAGILRARIGASTGTGSIRITSVAYERSTQIFLRGHFPIYNASPALRAFAESFC